MTPYYVNGNIALYHGDCLEGIAQFPTLSLIVTSPPYNLGSGPWPRLGHWKQGDSAGGKSKWKNGSDGGGGTHYATHQDTMPWAEYVAWQQAVLSLCWQRLSPHGAIFYNHKPRVIGARLWTPLELVPAEVVLRQIIIWARPGGMNFNPTAFVPTHEWILLLAKAAFRLRTKAVSGLGDVWRMSPARGNAHPAPFPIELPTKVFEAVPEGMVLDPFCGSGTTLLAAQAVGRAAVGIEVDERYCELAAQRLETRDDR